MIRSFADEETERIWGGRRSRKLPPDIQRTARRKRADEPAAVAPTVWGAANLAFNTWRPAAVLIGQRVLGAKNFKELARK